MFDDYFADTEPFRDRVRAVKANYRRLSSEDLRRSVRDLFRAIRIDFDPKAFPTPHSIRLLQATQDRALLHLLSEAVEERALERLVTERITAVEPNSCQNPALSDGPLWLAGRAMKSFQNKLNWDVDGRFVVCRQLGRAAFDRLSPTARQRYGNLCAQSRYRPVTDFATLFACLLSRRDDLFENAVTFGDDSVPPRLRLVQRAIDDLRA